MVRLVHEGLGSRWACRPNPLAALAGTCEKVFGSSGHERSGPGWSCHDTYHLVPDGLAKPDRTRGLRDRRHHGVVTPVIGEGGPI